MTVFFVGSEPETGFWRHEAEDIDDAMHWAKDMLAEDAIHRRHEGEPYPAIYVGDGPAALRLWRERTGSNERTFPPKRFYIVETKRLEKTKETS